MGLDMYLSARKYLWADSPLQIEVNKVTKDIRGVLQAKQISFEAMYWRKANAIHNWFVNNVQDGEDNCAEYYVGREQLEELLDIIEQVLADTGLASELLPTTSGFFFGSTNIDEWYFQDLEETKERLTELMKDQYKDFDFYYRSSW